MSGERWLPVVGFEGLYEVSDLGRVRSLRTDRVLSTEMNHLRGGYVRVKFSINRKWHRSLVHRLVLEAFVGPLPEGMVTRHLNGEPTDNRLENIVYGTQSENQHDAVRHGRNWAANKTHCANGHLLDGDNVRMDRGRRKCVSCERQRGREYRARMREKSREELRHGTQGAYIAGCRCVDCKATRSARYFDVEKPARIAARGVA